MEDRDGRTVHHFPMAPGEEFVRQQVPVPGSPGELEWRDVRVIKEINLISVGPVDHAPWPGVAPQAEPVSITCPQCQRVSYDPDDVKHRYCGNCHQFHDQMPGGQQ